MNESSETPWTSPEPDAPPAPPDAWTPGDLTAAATEAGFSVGPPSLSVHDAEEDWDMDSDAPVVLSQPASLRSAAEPVRTPALDLMTAERTAWDSLFDATLRSVPEARPPETPSHPTLADDEPATVGLSKEDSARVGEMASAPSESTPEIALGTKLAADSHGEYRLEIVAELGPESAADDEERDLPAVAQPDLVANGGPAADAGSVDGPEADPAMAPESQMADADDELGMVASAEAETAGTEPETEAEPDVESGSQGTYGFAEAPALEPEALAEGGTHAVSEDPSPGEDEGDGDGALEETVAPTDDHAAEAVDASTAAVSAALEKDDEGETEMPSPEDRWWLEPDEASVSEASTATPTEAGTEGEPPTAAPPRGESATQPETGVDPEPAESGGTASGTLSPPSSTVPAASGPGVTDRDKLPTHGVRELSVLGVPDEVDAAEGEVAQPADQGGAERDEADRRVFTPPPGKEGSIAPRTSDAPAAATKATREARSRPRLRKPAGAAAPALGSAPDDVWLLASQSDRAGTSTAIERDPLVSVVMTVAAVIVVIFLVVGFVVIFTDLS